MRRGGGTSFGQGQCGLANTLVVGGAAVGDTPVIVGDLEIIIRVSVTCTIEQDAAHTLTARIL